MAFASVGATAETKGVAMRFTTGLISELQALLTECADPKVKELVMDAYYSHSGTERGVVYVFGGHAIPSRKGGAHKVAAYLYGIGAGLGLWERLMDDAPESWRRAREIVDAAARNLGGEFEFYKEEGKSYGRMVGGGTLSR